MIRWLVWFPFVLLVSVCTSRRQKKKLSSRCCLISAFPGLLGKNYSTPVPLSDVAKFKEVLALNDIPFARGVFVTTNTFVPRATTIGIPCIDGKQFRLMEKRALTMVRIFEAQMR